MVVKHYFFIIIMFIHLITLIDGEKKRKLCMFICLLSYHLSINLIYLSDEGYGRQKTS